MKDLPMNSRFQTSRDRATLGIPGAIARRKWLVLACVLVAAGSAYAYSATRTPIYTAVTELKYEQQVDISNPLDTGSSNFNAQQVALELESVESEVNGARVIQAAAAQLGVSPADKQLTASVAVVPNTTVVKVSASSPQPRMAAAIANALAIAFVEVQKETERAKLAQAVAVVQEKLRSFKDPVTHESADYILLSQRLSDLQIAQATVTGNYLVISPAGTPTSPSSPHPKRDAALGLIFGLFAGICFAVVLEQFDTKAGSHRDVAELLQLPVLGRVPVVSKRLLAKGPMVVLLEPNSPAAESFRLLRRNLETAALEKGLSTILVASGAPREGKSLTVSNLAVSLAMGGKRVGVVDCDLRRPQLHHIFDLDNSVGLSSVLSGGAELVSALKPVKLPSAAPRVLMVGKDGGADPNAKNSDGGSLVVLTSGPQASSPGELLASGRFAAVLRLLEESSVDVVLLDSPAFLAVSDAAVIGADADGVLLLVDVESATTSLLAEARDFLNKLPCHKLGVVTVRERHRGKQYGYGVYNKGLAGAEA